MSHAHRARLERRFNSPSPFPCPRGHVRDILPAFIVTHVGARLLIRSGSELLRVYPSRAGIPRRETGWREDTPGCCSLFSVKCPSLPVNVLACGLCFRGAAALPSGCTGFSHPPATPSPRLGNAETLRSACYCPKLLTL